jgi:uncharacterized peroxidase-related enzyme
MSRYPAPELKDLPEDIRAKVLEVQNKAGFVPNVFLALARRPAEWRAFFAYHDALMLKEDSGLSKGDREMIVTTTSAANNCLYCVVAHGAILRIYEKKPLVADQVAVNYRKADITPRQSAMLDFAMKVCLHSDQIADADFAALHAHGFNELLTDAVVRMQRRQRILEDHGHLATTKLAHILVVHSEQVLTVEDNTSADPCRLAIEQAHHGLGCDALARA